MPFKLVTYCINTTCHLSETFRHFRFWTGSKPYGLLRIQKQHYKGFVILSYDYLGHKIRKLAREVVQKYFIPNIFITVMIGKYYKP
jgi:hypothetical protein